MEKPTIIQQIEEEISKHGYRVLSREEHRNVISYHVSSIKEETKKNEKERNRREVWKSYSREQHDEMGWAICHPSLARIEGLKMALEYMERREMQESAIYKSICEDYKKLTDETSKNDVSKEGGN